MIAKRHFVYWQLPAIVMLTMILMYYSGIGLLQNIIAAPSDRELGLLEHLQALILLASVAVALRAWRTAPHPFERALFAVVALGVFVLFLEEIDYGLHYWEWLTGASTGAKVRNFHNIGNNTNLLKGAANGAIGLVLVILPLAGPRIRAAWIRYFIPDRMIISTVLLLPLCAVLAQTLERRGWYPNGPLIGNVSEFEECVIYYLGLLYTIELAGRSWPGFKPVDANAPEDRILR